MLAYFVYKNHVLVEFLKILTYTCVYVHVLTILSSTYKLILLAKWTNLYVMKKHQNICLLTISNMCII